jgi:hypothetical protein
VATLKQRTKVSGVGCQAKATPVKSGTWSLSGTRLKAQTLVSIKLPATSGAGLSGLLGSDEPSHFGASLIDHASGIATDIEILGAAKDASCLSIC